MKKIGRNQNLDMGFTIIELLVVISIIGILSAAVLASLNNARAKASDATIKSNLRGIVPEAEIYLDDHQYSYGAGTGVPYNGVCPDNALAAGSNRNLFGDGNIKSAIAGSVSQSGGIDDVATNKYTNSYCSVTANTWAIAIRLKTADDPETVVTTPTKPNSDAWCVDNTSVAKEFHYTSVGDNVSKAISGGKCN